MVSPRRRTALVVGLLVVVAATLSVVFVTRDSPASSRDAVVLHGRAPRTVELSLRVSTGGSLRTSGTVWIDARSNSLSAHLEVPMVTSDTSVEVRAVNQRLYITSPNLDGAAGPVWFTRKLNWPALQVVVSNLVHPSAALLSVLANARITHAGSFTTYEFHDSHLALGTVGRAISAAGRLRVRLTTGRHGEVTRAWVSLTSSSASTTVTLVPLSFGFPVAIVAPPASQHVTSASPLISQLFSTGVLGGLVLPEQWLRVLNAAKLS